MTRKNVLMLASAMVFAGALGAAGLAVAQPGPRGAGGAAIYYPAQLPQTNGKVGQYLLSPRGDVVGLILADGTEVFVPPHVATQLVFAVRPGDAVTIHGVKARALPMLVARSVTNDATGANVLVTMGHGRGGGLAALEAEGKVAATLHTPRGEVNGVRLEDGTIVRLPPGEATRLAETLAPGKSIAVRGDGYAGALGRAIAARQIGADKASMKDVAGPHPGERRFGRDGDHGKDHDGMGGGRMGRPDGDDHRPGMMRRHGERG